jgi:hypothetical protein
MRTMWWFSNFSISTTHAGKKSGQNIGCSTSAGLLPRHLLSPDDGAAKILQEILYIFGWSATWVSLKTEFGAGICGNSTAEFLIKN